jgi:XXXCH domain-containing protein
MDQERVADQKYRPLKKAMQQTMKRIERSVHAGALPERGLVEEFVSQVRIMVSYPGFGDAAYPEILAASAALAESSANADLAQCHQALTAILALKKRCHCLNSPTPCGRGD